MEKNLMLLIVLLLTYHAKPTKIRVKECNNNLSIRRFTIGKTKQCAMQKITKTKQCTADIFNINLHGIRVPANICKY